MSPQSFLGLVVDKVSKMLRGTGDRIKFIGCTPRGEGKPMQGKRVVRGEPAKL